MGFPLVKTAILLAAWNGKEWIDKQVRSLQAMDDSVFFVLYQDDGSTDETRKLLDRVAEQDPRFRPGTEQGKHLGPAGNFFSLMKQADADLYLPCDQDDIWVPKKLALLKKQMATEAAANGENIPLLVHSDASLINDQDTIIGDSFFSRQGWDPGATSLQQLLVQNNVTGCCLMMNRALRDLVVRYGQPEKMFMHDWFIAQTASAFGKIAFVNEPLVQYRQHEGNAVGASNEGMLARGARALRMPDRAKERIRLTYQQANAFREVYGDALPPVSAEIVETYLKTETMPWILRVGTIWRNGYRMQSLVPRLGQIFFG